MLHYYNVGNTFIETMATISSTPIVTLIKAVAENTTTPAVMFYLNNFVNMNEKTLLGVFAELSRNITLFITDSNVSTALSKDKVITPDDLERGHDIFINIPESRLRQWKGMLTLIVSQFLRHFENRPDKNNSPILFLLDEFARLGKLEGITDGLATLRSKKITICPIIQDLAQLDYIYGTTARQVIVGTCQYQVIFNVTDGDSQKYFSELLGKYKEIKISKTQNFDITNLSTGASTHTNTEDRPRLESWDFYTLPDIVLLTPYGFCRIDKDPYYKYKKV
jgi:type IV secretion system protein VirD4